MTETIKGRDLLSLNLSVKPLVGSRSRRQVATLDTSGCVCNRDQSDRPVSVREAHLPVFIYAEPCIAPDGCSTGICGEG